MSSTQERIAIALFKEDHPYGNWLDDSADRTKYRKMGMVAVSVALTSIRWYRDLDGSTGEEWDNGYEQAHRDALDAVRAGI